MKQALENKPITLVGDGEQKFAFTHVSDIAPVIAKSPFVKEAYNEVFNIGAEPKPNTLKNLASEIFRAFGQESNIEHIPARKEAKAAFSSIEKAKKIFLWEPKITLREGIEKTAAWVKKTGTRREVEISEIEIQKNFPPNWVKDKKS